MQHSRKGMRAAFHISGYVSMVSRVAIVATLTAGRMGLMIGYIAALAISFFVMSKTESSMLAASPVEPKALA